MQSLRGITINQIYLQDNNNRQTYNCMIKYIEVVANLLKLYQQALLKYLHNCKDPNKLEQPNII